MEEDGLAFGRWRIFPRRRQIQTTEGDHLSLGSRAFDLLLALMEARGGLLTKDDLLARIWPGTVVAENNIQVQISNLRRVLGDEASQMIVTIPGRGYRFAGRVEAIGAEAEPSAPIASDRAFLCGAFACYSHAQSPYYRGQLIRGALSVAPADGPDRFTAAYSQALPTGRAEARGPVIISASTVSLQLTELNIATAPPCVHLVRPAMPGSVLAGMMIGAVLLSPDRQPPYATRIVMVRVPLAAEALTLSNRYLDPTERGAICADLSALGLTIGDPAELEAQLRAFLFPAESLPGTDRLSAASYAELAAACDRCWFDTLAARDAVPA